ncbi:DNA primase, partial [hydrothermal vent metagenome]
LKDIALSGLVGEERNAMIAYITYTGRKREKPLHIMCLGVSGSGKTYLQEKIGELIPEEDKLEITMLSENAFYYFGKEELKHKLILIEDLDGAENVLYPLRELQSKRKISKTVTLKDNKGNLKTITLEVNGPVSVSSCTTKEKIYEDNANRCILLYIDAGKTQDKRISDYQKAESAGKVNYRSENQIKDRFKNIQRTLKPINVVNPYAQLIDLPEEVFKPRRTLTMLLSFIETITYYHQYQRTIKAGTETRGRYIKSTVADVEHGFRLMRDVLFRKSDELSGACRSFFEELKEYVSSEGLPKEEPTFYKREIRAHLRMNPNNLKRYLRELLAYGHIKVTGGSKYRGYEYSMVNEAEYNELKEKIDQQLEVILQKIRALNL